MKRKNLFFSIIVSLSLFCSCLTACAGGEIAPGNTDVVDKNTDVKPVLQYSFDENGGYSTKETVSGENFNINYVFSYNNAAGLFKEPSEPLRKAGVKGNSLYMDGFSTYITDGDFETPASAITLSAWVAPRVFENLVNYGDGSEAAGHPRMTSVINKGDIEMGEGFLLGYGRLGLWGAQLALYNTDNDEYFVVGFYDPINSLPLYEWSHIAAVFDGESGYIALFFNGVRAYESYIPELSSCRLVSSEEPLYVGRYVSPMVEFGISRQMISGLLDEVSIYSGALTPREIQNIYSDTDQGGHPTLEFSEIALDSSVYEGDRYRPQYHAIPPAVWMNEPHSPFYYKGRYHVFYQHNPAGPYWSQIRWAHIASDDMVHWEYVKDAVVPTPGICPEGVWTGGAVIGPDGKPWLAITAGTNTTTWSIQHVAFAHAVDPDDPDLTDWTVEDTVVLPHPNDNSQGEINQFRDPFVWYDDGTYYMMVSTSIPDAGGSANIYTSTNMHEWEYRGYLYQCDYVRYPEQGAHWECVVMLPISTKDGSVTKYVLFDCPQYTVDGYVVDCYYWIGTFDKNTCRFIADDDKPQLFDLGRGVYTGQNGFCYLTEEDMAAGKTSYELGRTILYAIAQGKDAGTAQNYTAGWAHNFAIPLELHLSDDGRQIIREPIEEARSLRKKVLYDYTGEGKTASQINGEISDIRGDLLEIRAKITLDPSTTEYSGGIRVRYNKNVVNSQTERTDIVFSDKGVYIERAQSSLLDYVSKQPSRTYQSVKREYEIVVLLDRSMLEVYVDGLMSFTLRIYPKYSDSDYLNIFDDNAGITFKSLQIYEMGSAYSDTVTPAYYGNVGSLGGQE
ncbi:MAG: GH32 C-terminal domain-containing protein [Clostridia bacterium]|nr:GH32 C-terminal domain-containing protein [Clostridia bacterium]